jgi:hypothetical protein
MSYTYLGATLYTIDDGGVQIRPTKTYLPTPASPQSTVSVGEKLRLTMQVRKSPGTFADGEIFVFNARLFGDPSQNPTPPIIGSGWRIDITDNGGLVGVATLVTNLSTTANNNPQQNLSLQNISFISADTIMVFDFEFVVTIDIAEWIGAVVVNNGSRLLKTTIENPNELNNNSASSFSRVDSIIELFFYEANNQLDPVTFIDPIARTLAAPQLNTFSIPISTKYYDDKVGGGSNWVTATTKEDNFLEVVEVTGGNITNSVEVNHKANPFKSPAVLANFDIVDNRLVRDSSMDVHLEINSPEVLNAYTHILATLIRVDNVVDSTDFLTAYQSNIALIPKLDVTTNWINGEAFGTPSAWGVAAGILSIDFKLDGTKLDPTGTYQIIILTIENNEDYSSSHITPPLTPLLAPINLPTSITGVIETYNNQFTNINDVSIANFERVKLRIEVDATGYPNFASELSTIRLKSTLLGQDTEVSTFRYPSGPGSGPLQIAVTSAFPLFTFEVELRGPHNTSPSTPLQSFQEWELVMEANGIFGVEEVVIKFEQLLKHRGDDTTRLNGFRVLDYGDFQIGTLTEKKYICTDDDKVVLEYCKNGGANMNLLAMFMSTNPISQPLESIEEEESYASAFLPQLSSGFLEDVDVSFTTQLDPDKAYFVLDTSTLQQGGDYYVEALTYNI